MVQTGNQTSDMAVEGFAVALQDVVASSFVSEQTKKEQSKAIERLITSASYAEHTNASQLATNVADYVRSSAKDGKKAGFSRVGLVESIQFEKRYKSLIRTDDSEMLLSRLQQTIRLIENKALSDSPESISQAFETSAAATEQFCRQLSGIAVVEPEEREADSSEERSGPFESVRKAFYEELGVQDSTEDTSISDALDKARELIYERWDREAKEVAGSTLDTSNLVALAPIQCTRKIDQEPLLQLLREVKRSFETYQKLVHDNGLLCAFGSYGGSGIFEGNSFFYFGDPTRSQQGANCDLGLLEQAAADADERGGLEMIIARMHEANALPYEGILDERKLEHADTFWYGLATLAHLSETAIEYDHDVWPTYVNNNAEELSHRASELGRRMNGKQVAAYHEAIEKLQ